MAMMCEAAASRRSAKKKTDEKGSECVEPQKRGYDVWWARNNIKREKKTNVDLLASANNPCVWFTRQRKTKEIQVCSRENKKASTL